MKHSKPVRQRLPKHICSLLAQKERLFLSFSDPLKHPLYIKICKDIAYHSKKYREYQERKLAYGNFRALFMYVKSKTKDKSFAGPFSDSKGIRCYSDLDKAAALGAFFGSVFDSSMPTNSSQSFFPTINHSCDFSPVHPSDVYSLLIKLKPSLSLTSDRIPQIVLKNCAKTICLPLTHIFNISLMLGQVPTVWKHAIVTAIPKITKPISVSDFRPISITPSSCKILEKLIRNKILSWLQKFNLIPVEQHGFIAGASTTTQLVDCMHDWKFAIGQGSKVDVLYFDLSKAFDKVNHIKLLEKLKAVGIGGCLLSWLQSYLHERVMTCKVNLAFSDLFTCTSGVPQGGVLSPLLFLIYTSELPSLLKTHPNIHIVMYADDIKVYGTYDSHSASEVRQSLQLSIDRIVQWGTANNIKVNLKKVTFFI